MVPVISKTGKRLMPTSEYRARKLLARGKAVIDRYHPFTIRLTEREDGDTQPIEITIDTGYAHIGNSVKTEKHELSAVEVRPLADEKKRHNDRLMHRRQRRSRLRHRKPRFDNRKKKRRMASAFYRTPRRPESCISQAAHGSGTHHIYHDGNGAVRHPGSEGCGGRYPYSRRERLPTRGTVWYCNAS